MKTKVLKIMVTFLLLVGLIMMNRYNVFAVRDPAAIEIPDSVDGDEEIEEIGEEVLGIVTVVGYAIAIVISIIIGIKYMTGSVEEKAGYKKSMIPYIVGCVILVAAPALTNVVYDISKAFKKSEVEEPKVIKVSYCNLCGDRAEECENSRFHPLYECYYCTGCKESVR